MTSTAEDASSSVSVPSDSTQTVTFPTIAGPCASRGLPLVEPLPHHTQQPLVEPLPHHTQQPLVPPLPHHIQQPLVPPLPHHTQQPLCLSRPRYRQGRRLTAVKAYTISDESVYLLINGVPGLKLQRELKNLCQKHGTVLSLKVLDDYPVEPFAEAYLVKYGSVRESRFAKKMLDGKNFFGGVFHVCYAPELESVDETREKLEERRRAVQFAIRKQEMERKRLEAGSEEGGSVLCQYHPDDRLASAIKRVTNRLSYNKGPMIIGPNESSFNLRNDANSDHLFDSSLDNLAGCVSTQSQDNTSLFNNGVSCITTGNSSTAITSKNTSESVPNLQAYNPFIPPPPFKCSGDRTTTNSECKQVPYVSETSEREGSSSTANGQNLPSHDERLVNPTNEPWQDSSSAAASVGQQYASMSADYEPGLGLTEGERYAASTKKRKHNSLTNKTNVRSFTIKPTKAYKRRKVDATDAEKRGKAAASEPKLGYREVVRSLQQRSSEENEQLARLQMALHATLGAPTGKDKVGSAPNRPTAKIKLLTQGVKLV